MMWSFFCHNLANSTLMKNKYFAAVMSVVCDLTDLSEDVILHGRRTQEVVDARWLSVRLLRDIGLYPAQIADFMEMTPRNVNDILNTFDDRMMFGDVMLKNYLFIAKKRLDDRKENDEK